MSKINPLTFLPRRLLSHAQKTALNFESIPGPKPLPVFGNVWRYLPVIGDYDVNDLFKNAKFNKTRYGKLVREQITRNHVVLHLFEPKDIEAFFRQDSGQPSRRSHRALLKLRHDNPERYNDGGIFSENGTKWFRIRSMFNKSLTKETVIAKRAKILDDVTTNIIDSIRVNKPRQSSSIQLDKFEKYLYRWGVRCGLAVFLDYNNSTMPEDKVLDQIIACSNDQLEALAATEIRSNKWVSKPSKCPFYAKLLKEEDFMYEFVTERINYLMKTGSTNDVSFVRDWLIREKFDSKDVITFLIDCLVANLHTTVYTCMFLLENISRRLDDNLRSRLLEEVSNTLRGNHMTDNNVFKAINKQLPILKDCLKETLRLHPVSIGTGRLTQCEMILQNYHIPAGVMVIAHNQMICRDASIYEDPDEYRPDRWAHYRSLARSERPSSFAWLPFGFGPRICLGQRLVTLQIYIMVVRLLQSFNLTISSGINTRTTLVHHLEGNISVTLDLVDR